MPHSILRSGLTIGLLAVVCGTANAETPAEAGKRAFAAGVALVQDPDGAKYDDALAEFRKAYQLLKNWKILGNIGLCALELERDGEAIEAYQGYLQAGARQLEPSEREQVERDLSRLTSQVVGAHFESEILPATLIDERVNAKGKVLRNEYPLSTSALDLGLHPGHHLFMLRSAQGETRFAADLSSGGKVSHRFDAPPKPVAARTSDARQQQRIAGWAVGGAGVVALGVGGWLALSAKQKYSESDPFCSGNQCDAQGVAIADDARSKGTAATFVIAAGAIAAAAGAVLWLTAPPGSSEQAVAGAPSIGIAPSGIVVGKAW